MNASLFAHDCASATLTRWQSLLTGHQKGAQELGILVARLNPGKKAKDIIGLLCNESSTNSRAGTEVFLSREK